MEKIRFWIRKTFGFSQKETNGFLLLSFLIILTVLAPAVFNYFYQLSVENNSQKDKEMLNQLIRDWKGSRRQKTDIELKKKACVAFNPNMANEKELTDLLGKQASRNILKYRSKGGRFRSADELKKVYGMNDSLFESIKRCIDIPDESVFKKSILKHQNRVDINLADTNQLQELRGIGKVLASRIIRFRNKLGGFVSKNQFREVYGLDSLALTELEKHTFISSNFIPRLIDLNSAEAKDLYAHPYIGKEMAKRILLVRKQKGIIDKGKLKEIFSGEALLKLNPYLDQIKNSE